MYWWSKDINITVGKSYLEVSMMNTYEINREFADKHLPQVQKIIAEEITSVSSFEEDTKQATDLIVITCPRGQVAVRIRRPGYAERYPWEFTIRFRAANMNYHTEYQKILDEGWADWLFYGHLNQEGQIFRWFLIDLDVFRKEMKANISIGIKVHTKTNFDREKTQLKAFDVRWFSPNLILKSSHEIPYT